MLFGPWWKMSLKIISSSEIGLCQSGHAGPALDSERRLLDVYREKPVRLTVRIAVPVKEHPKVNSKTLRC